MPVRRFLWSFGRSRVCRCAADLWARTFRLWNSVVVKTFFSVHVRPAAPADTTAAAGVLRLAAQRLVDRGEALWEPQDFTPEELARRVGSGELHVAVHGDELVGVFLLQREDPVRWPDAAAGEALYVHKLAVRPDLAGRGIAHAMLRFALGQAHAQQRRFLRLDCAPRPKLRAVYETFGFRRRDAGLWPGERYDVMRYEMLAVAQEQTVSGPASLEQ